MHSPYYDTPQEAQSFLQQKQRTFSYYNSGSYGKSFHGSAYYTSVYQLNENGLRNALKFRSEGTERAIFYNFMINYGFLSLEIRCLLYYALYTEPKGSRLKSCYNSMDLGITDIGKALQIYDATTLINFSSHIHNNWKTLWNNGQLKFLEFDRFIADLTRLLTVPNENISSNKARLRTSYRITCANWETYTRDSNDLTPRWYIDEADRIISSLGRPYIESIRSLLASNNSLNRQEFFNFYFEGHCRYSYPLTKDEDYQSMRDGLSRFHFIIHLCQTDERFAFLCEALARNLGLPMINVSPPPPPPLPVGTRVAQSAQNAMSGVRQKLAALPGLMQRHMGTFSSSNAPASSSNAPDAMLAAEQQLSPPLSRRASLSVHPLPSAPPADPWLNFSSPQPGPSASAPPYSSMQPVASAPNSSSVPYGHVMPPEYGPVPSAPPHLNPAAAPPFTQAKPEPKPEFICPITQEIMRDPVIAADGHTYEREAITTWLSSHTTSPMTNGILENKNLIPNHSLRSMIISWKQKHGL